MERIGRYEIVSELGRGAMGIVYLAHDPRIGRDVAIKTIKLADQAAPDERQALRDRLFREAQSAGRLSHPGIVTIYDIAEESGVAYITMEFVEGRTLESMINAGEVGDLDSVARLVEQMASALDYAHAREIVHRDIKPANILVTPDGHVKITDFGIARITSSTMTQTGTVMGTPSYMSPEQARGETIDGRSDQFSLTVITYELVTGRKPFTGDSLPAVIFKIVSENPAAPHKFNPDLPDRVDATILRGLAKSAQDRFENCRALSDELTSCLGLSEPAALNVTPLRTRRQPRWATVVAELEETAPVSATQQATSINEQETVFAKPADKLTLPPLPAKKQVADEKRDLPLADLAPPTRKRGPRIWLGAALAGLLGVAVAAVAMNPWLLDDAMEALGLAATGLVDAPAPPGDGQGEPLGTGDTARGGAPSTSTTPPPTDTVLDATVTLPVEPPVTEPEPDPPPVVDKAQPKPPPVLTVTSFTSEARGTKVVVDGKAEWTCTTPCELELPAGNHTAVASLAGYYPHRKSFQSAADPMSVGFKPVAIVGTLMVSSTPQGATVFVDGRKQDQPTNTILKLKPGEHVIRVEGPDMPPSEKIVEVTANETTSLRFAATGR